MAVGQGRGLSRSVFQAPDFIGEQRQERQLQLREDAMSARLQRQGKTTAPDPINLSEDTFMGTHRFFEGLNQKWMGAMKGELEANGGEFLANPEARSRFSSITQQYKTSMEALEDVGNSLEEYTKNYSNSEFSRASAREWLEKINSAEIQIADGVPMMVIDGEQVSPTDFLKRLDFKDSVFTPEDWRTAGTAFAGDARFSNKSGSSLDKNKVTRNAKTFSQTGIYSVGNETKLEGLVGDYLKNEQGLSGGDAVSIYYDLIGAAKNGERDAVIRINDDLSITPRDVEKYAEREILKSVENSASTTIKEPEEEGGQNFESWLTENNFKQHNVVKKDTPLKEWYSYVQAGKPLGVTLPDNVDLNIIQNFKDENEETQQRVVSSQVEAVFKVGKGYVGLLVFDNTKKYESLTENQVLAIETDLKIPSGKNLGDLVSEVNKGKDKAVFTPEPVNKPKQKNKPSQTSGMPVIEEVGGVEDIPVIEEVEERETPSGIVPVINIGG
jgi:muconolactone delta-isomerase